MEIYGAMPQDDVLVFIVFMTLVDPNSGIRRANSWKIPALHKEPSWLCLLSKKSRCQVFLSFISIPFLQAQKHIEQSWTINEEKHAISEVLIFSSFPCDYYITMMMTRNSRISDLQASLVWEHILTSFILYIWTRQQKLCLNFLFGIHFVSGKCSDIIHGNLKRLVQFHFTFNRQ